MGEALAEIMFWSGPTIAVAVVLLSRRSAIVGGAAGATFALSLIWWNSARDWHSTASWRPALAGWLLLPIGLLVLRFPSVAPTVVEPIAGGRV